MKVAELIEILKTCDPDLPVATHANNHSYNSGTDSGSHGPMRVALLHTCGGDHICIGNLLRMDINKPNWYVKKVLDNNGPIDE